MKSFWLLDFAGMVDSTRSFLKTIPGYLPPSIQGSTLGSDGRASREGIVTDGLEPQAKDFSVRLRNLTGLWPPVSVWRKMIRLLTTNALCWLADAPIMETFSAVVVAGTSSS